KAAVGVRAAGSQRRSAGAVSGRVAVGASEEGNGAVNADLKTWVRAEWDRVAGVALLAVGVVVLIFGYIGVSNSTDTPEALCYVVSGGIGSILLFGAGAVLLISADLHDEWRKLNRIEAAL